MAVLTQSTADRSFHATEAYFERWRTVPMGEWQSYSPVLSSLNGTVLHGNAVGIAIYTVIGNTCVAQGRIATGSTTNFGTGGADLLLVSLPIPILETTAMWPMGNGLLYNGTNGALGLATVTTASWYFGGGYGNRILFMANYASSNVYAAANAPWTWTNTVQNQLHWNLTYRIA